MRPDQLKAACRFFGYSARSLAEKVGCSTHLVESWRMGRRPIRAQWRLRLLLLFQDDALRAPLGEARCPRCRGLTFYLALQGDGQFRAMRCACLDTPRTFKQPSRELLAALPIVEPTQPDAATG